MPQRYGSSKEKGVGKRDGNGRWSSRRKAFCMVDTDI